MDVASEYESAREFEEYVGEMRILPHGVSVVTLEGESLSLNVGPGGWTDGNATSETLFGLLASRSEQFEQRWYNELNRKLSGLAG